MAFRAHRTLAVSVQMTCMLVLVLAMPRGCGDGRPGARVGRDAPLSSTIVHFDRDDAVTDALDSLDAIVDHARSAARVLIVGYANERSSLLENLNLAEQRARFVANELVSRGISRSRLVVASVEAPPDDPASSRCEIEIASAALHTVAANLDRESFRDRARE
jgi:hypothetical protein